MATGSRSALSQSLYHTVLAAGGLLFAAPFLWLLSGSLKEHEEFFAPRPVWFPALPQKVASSPYVEPGDEGVRPAGIPAARWADLEPRLLDVFEERIRETAPAHVLETLGLLPGLGKAVARGAVNSVAARFGADLARDRGLPRSDDEVVGFAAGQIDDELVDRAWSRSFRGVLVGELVAYYRDGSTETVLGFSRYRGADGAAGVSAGPRLAYQERPGTLLAYDFGSGGPAALQLRLAAPLRTGDIVRLVLPVRGDRSYHDLVATLRTGGAAYRTLDPFVLENDRWMDAIWTFEDPTLRERRTVYHSAELTPFEQLDGSGAGGHGPSLTLAFERVSYPRVLYRRLIRNYAGATLAIPFARYFYNTVVITVLNIGATLLSCSLIAYGFARLRWPGRGFLFALVLATMMLPPQVTMIPQFLIWRGLGQYDTYQPLWLPALFGSGFFIFLMRQFMLSIPKDLEDAARIDGAGYLATFRHVILPLLKPALAAVCIFQFMGTWNDFLGPLIYLSSQDKAPLSLGLFHFRGSHFVNAVGEVGLLMAASMIMVLPVIILFFSAQRYFIQGITFTGMRN